MNHGDTADAVAHELHVIEYMNLTSMQKVQRVIFTVLGRTHLARLQVTDDRYLVRNVRRLPFHHQASTSRDVTPRPAKRCI